MYICQLCNQKPATVHLTDIHNNVKKELHMCEGCAGKKGFVVQGSINLSQVVGAASAPAVQDPVGGAEDPVSELVCDNCGMTWSEFRSHGRFGCARDYVAFRQHLLPMIGDIHGHRTEHIGKHPCGSGEATCLRRDVMELRGKLRDAVGREAYEEAAALRDQLKDLEARLDRDS